MDLAIKMGLEEAVLRPRPEIQRIIFEYKTFYRQDEDRKQSNAENFPKKKSFKEDNIVNKQE